MGNEISKKRSAKFLVEIEIKIQAETEAQNAHSGKIMTYLGQD
jgi:hypothetical protein